MLATISAVLFGAAPQGREARADALPAQSDRIVSYQIDVRLDPTRHTLEGHEVIRWRNPAREPATDLWFHLYLNAFKNDRSTFLRERRHLRGGRFELPPSEPAGGDWGYVDIDSLRVGGVDLTGAIRFEHPDDDNAEDETVARVPLVTPVPAGALIEIRIDFHARLPKAVARSGWVGDFHLVAQWYPKLGVLEPAGVRGRAQSGWNCHQYHATGEFYADFGTYEVSITVPASEVVGATGRRVGTTHNPGGTVTHRYVAEDVHDFAFSSDPRSIEIVRPFRFERERDPALEAELMRIFGEPVEAVRLGDVDVRLLARPERRHLADRYFRAAFSAIRYFGYWYGRYPYANLTIVDPPYGGEALDGMEYPTFIVGRTSLLAGNAWEGPEGVTVHEFGHQYWYGLVGTNEFEESWLDEGLNTYSTARVMDRAYGSIVRITKWAGIGVQAVPVLDLFGDCDSLLCGAGLSRWHGAAEGTLLGYLRDLPFLNYARRVRVDSETHMVSRYLRAPTDDPMARAAWRYYPDSPSYWVNSYDRPALWLRTLERALGPERFLRAMRRYAGRYRFRHPSTEDFLGTVIEVTGEERIVRALSEPVLTDTRVVDYAVGLARSEERRPPAGVFGSGPARKLAKRDAAPRGAAKVYESVVLVRRRSALPVPVDVEFEFAPSPSRGRPERSRERWDGLSSWREFRFLRPERLVEVRVDPDRRLALERVRLDNERRVEADHRIGLRWGGQILLWVQHLLFFAGTFG